MLKGDDCYGYGVWVWNFDCWWVYDGVRCNYLSVDFRIDERIVVKKRYFYFVYYLWFRCGGVNCWWSGGDV